MFSTMEKNRRILNETREYRNLRKLIQEELGISNEVKLLSGQLIKKIMEEYQPGYTLKVTPFSKGCGEYTISFDFTDYPKKPVVVDTTGGFKAVTYFSKHKIRIIGYTVNGKIPSDSLSEVLQHELKHIFDLYKSNREGFFNSTRDAGIYTTAATQAMNKTLPTGQRAIGYAIYLSYDFEGHAFESGTYAYLMKQNLHFIGDEVKAVKETMYYKRLMFVRYAYDFITKHEDKAEEIAETIYGKPYKWLRKKVTASLNSSRRQIGRAVAKVRNDYDWTRGGTSTIWA